MNFVPSYLDIAFINEWTVLPYFKSPHIPTVCPFKPCFKNSIVKRSVRVWVGCWWPPSPAFITGTLENLLATLAAPSFGCLIAIMSVYIDTIFIVSARVSPLDAEVEFGSEKPKILPPSLIIAASKLNLVLVLGS